MGFLCDGADPSVEVDCIVNDELSVLLADGTPSRISPSSRSLSLRKDFEKYTRNVAVVRDVAAQFEK